MSSFDRILEMVTEKNVPTYPLSDQNVTLNVPTVESASTHNTRVTMRAKAHIGDGYTGQVDLFYTRVNLTTLGTLAFWREQPFIYEELFALINQAKVAQMGPEDFTNDGLPVMENGVTYKFILSAKDESLAWLGNTQVTLLQGIPAEAPGLNDFWTNQVAALFAGS